MGRRVLLGVGGSIAAYKAASLTGELMKRGHEVRVTATPGAARFVTPLTFAALTHHPVPVEVWDGEESGEAIGHLALAGWAEILVVAPASAGVLARLALGLPDDMLGACSLAFSGPLVLAPAMETGMFTHPATSGHLETLRSRGARIVGPATGRLASGAEGVGRMVEIDEIADAVDAVFRDRDLGGTRILVTAGPTYEAIDSVRFIGNRSSGKMGFAIAAAAADRGADVCLVAGPNALPTPRNVRRVDIESGAEMQTAVLDSVASMDIVVMSAAVSDFRPAHHHEGKLRRSEGMLLELQPTDDIALAASVAAPHAIHVGFALEAGHLEKSAREKLLRKRLDLVVANEISAQHNPFGSDTNTVTIVSAKDAVSLPPMSKELVANRILDEAARLFRRKAAR